MCWRECWPTFCVSPTRTDESQNRANLIGSLCYFFLWIWVISCILLKFKCWWAPLGEQGSSYTNTVCCTTKLLHQMFLIKQISKDVCAQRCFFCLSQCYLDAGFKAIEQSEGSFTKHCHKEIWTRKAVKWADVCFQGFVYSEATEQKEPSVIAVCSGQKANSPSCWNSLLLQSGLYVNKNRNR